MCFPDDILRMTERIIRRRTNLYHIIKQFPVNNRDKRIMDEGVVITLVLREAPKQR